MLFRSSLCAPLDWLHIAEAVLLLVLLPCLTASILAASTVFAKVVSSVVGVIFLLMYRCGAVRALL